MRIYCVSFTSAECKAGEMCYPARTAEDAIAMCKADFGKAVIIGVEEVTK